MYNHKLSLIVVVTTLVLLAGTSAAIGGSVPLFTCPRPDGEAPVFTVGDTLSIASLAFAPVPVVGPALSLAGDTYSIMSIGGRALANYISGEMEHITIPTVGPVRVPIPQYRNPIQRAGDILRSLGSLLW